VKSTQSFTSNKLARFYAKQQIESMISAIVICSTC